MKDKVLFHSLTHSFIQQCILSECENSHTILRPNNHFGTTHILKI